VIAVAAGIGGVQDARRCYKLNSNNLLGRRAGAERVFGEVGRSGGVGWMSLGSRRQRCAFLGGIRRSGAIVVVDYGEGR
jgi:hypothetical protein